MSDINMVYSSPHIRINSTLPKTNNTGPKQEEIDELLNESDDTEIKKNALRGKYGNLYDTWQREDIEKIFKKT